ncbi:MAG: hypothetical protein ISR65_19040 [Bacteriovoracaceae bacterium]|nr:hypothetical protein [Bacteriovoracaceae bacterium]
MFRLLLIFTLLINVTVASAETNSKVSIKGKTRWRSEPGEPKQDLKQTITIKYKVDFSGKFQVVGLAKTGSKFTSGSNRIYDLESGDYEFDTEMAIRQLYIQSDPFGIPVQFGAMAPDKSLAKATGFTKSGWIDGARVKVKTPVGTMTVTGGALGDYKNPDAFVRRRKANYVEIKMSGKVFKKLKLEGAYERHEEVDFARAAAKMKVKLTATRAVKLVAEALMDVDAKEVKALVGASTDVDLFGLFIDNKDGEYDVQVSVQYLYMEEDPAKRANLSSGIYRDAPNSSGLVLFKGKVTDNIDWFSKVRVNQDSDYNRYELGLSYQFY